jgi:SAM-dependent methyltransferase
MRFKKVCEPLTRINALEGGTMADYSNFSAAREFVEFGLREKGLGRRQSISGPGSEQHAARPALALLDEIVMEYKVASILDLGCGDWSWMQHASWRTLPGICYEGWESHQGLVEHLTSEFGNESIVFRVADLTTEPLPRTDLVVCRDVLFHLRIESAKLVIARLQANGCLLLTTSFLEEETNADLHHYLPIDNWGFYRINLDVAPFNLAANRIRAVEEPQCAHRGSRRSACLYNLR